MLKFKDIGLSSQLEQKLERMAIKYPNPIQQLVIPKLLGSHQNALIIAQTGSGKSLAYLLPTVQNTEQDKRRTLILLPTRELAQQVSTICAELCAGTSLRIATIFGGVEYDPQREALGAKPHIIIATPGRLIDLIGRGEAHIDHLDRFILDEVDQMLDMGFRDAIKLLAALRGENAQCIAISATMPEVLTATLHDIAPQIETLKIETAKRAVETIEQRGYYVERDLMNPLLLHLLRKEQPSRAIIFTRSRLMAERIVNSLKENNIDAEAMHSERGQVAREHIIERFRGGETTIIVATDLISRGVDIAQVSHVFNYGLPQHPDQYLHRIGRCGRAGSSGVAITICVPEDKELLAQTCKNMKQHIDMSTSHPYFTPNAAKVLENINKGKSRR